MYYILYVKYADVISLKGVMNVISATSIIFC